MVGGEGEEKFKSVQNKVLAIVWAQASGVNAIKMEEHWTIPEEIQIPHKSYVAGSTGYLQPGVEAESAFPAASANRLLGLKDGVELNRTLGLVPSCNQELSSMGTRGTENSDTRFWRTGTFRNLVWTLGLGLQLVVSWHLVSSVLMAPNGKKKLDCVCGFTQLLLLSLWKLKSNFKNVD